MNGDWGGSAESNGQHGLGADSPTARQDVLLGRIARALGTVETLDEGLHVLTDALQAWTECASAEAWVRPDSNEQRLTRVTLATAAADSEASAAAPTTPTTEIGDGVPGRVWDATEPVWTVESDDEWSIPNAESDSTPTNSVEAAFGVPLDTGSRRVAVVVLYFTDSPALDEQLRDVVSAVVDDASGLVSQLDANAELERRQEMLDRLLETIPAGTMVTAPDGEITRINGRAEDALGLSEAEATGRQYTDLGLTAHDRDGNPIPVEDHSIVHVSETGEPVFGTEFGFVGPDGTERWVVMNSAPVMGSDGSVERVVSVARDVTAREERERQLRAFREAVEHTGHSVYLTDTDGTIEYVNPAFEELTGYDETDVLGKTPSILNSGEHDEDFYADLWETILAGEVWQGEVVNRRRSGERYTVNQTIAPVVDDNGDIDRFVAVNADISDQKRREEMLERRRNKLERIQQVTESLRPLNRELARASSRDEIQRLVCEQLAVSDVYQFVWYGDYNPAVGRVTPTEVVGVGGDFVDQFSVSSRTIPWKWHPFAEAIRTSEVHVARNVLSDEHGTDRRQHALSWGYQSLAAIPVAYGGTVYGVIGLYTSRPNAFDENERALLGELGRRIGHAMNAAENKYLLYTDTLVELEFRSEDPDSVFNELTTAVDCRVTLEAISPARDGGYVCYANVEGTPVATVRDQLDALTTDGHVRVVEEESSGGRVEFTLTSAPSATLLDYGATLRSLVAEDGTTTVVGEVAPETDVHEIIGGMHGHADTTFVAKRTIDRHESVPATSRETLDDVLTERQREVIDLAYHAGYFEAPRLSTGDDLASALDISSPTFYLHVRKAIKRILDQLLDEKRH
ncbi:PAS domain S-box protein [Haloferax larsenii]|uniref:PAS domain S-box protein n=1 Tax=Haloferax larsenii TaxID=302484 RepID=UPI0002B1CC62|nr:PAS domain S-box protein [Haloferax larsenii]ELZ80434.1 PAS domain S-box [Haloferax larsenii JCM 13917]